MAMTVYARESLMETRGHCRRAVDRLEQEIEWEMDAHNARLSKLQARLDDCKKTIDRITSDLAV